MTVVLDYVIELIAMFGFVFQFSWGVWSYSENVKVGALSYNQGDHLSFRFWTKIVYGSASTLY